MRFCISKGTTLANTITAMISKSVNWRWRFPGNIQENRDLLTIGVSAFAIESSFTLKKFCICENKKFKDFNKPTKMQLLLLMNAF